MTQTNELTPSFKIPMFLLIAAIPVVLVQKWVGLAISIFALFLWFQAGSLRLIFSPTALEVYRYQTQIRNFPYQEWLNWEIYSPAIPALFYFRETKSIHFLPILFDPQALQDNLRRHIPLGKTITE
jgi:hypothetical protein